MKYLTFIFMLSIQCSVAFGINLSLGETIQLPAPSQSKIHVGSKRILAVIDQGEKVLIVGKKVGETFIHLDGKTLHFRVSEKGQPDFFNALKVLFQKRLGPQAEWKDSRIHVTGKIYTFKDWLEISELAKKWEAHYFFSARPTAEVKNEAEKYFKNHLKSRGLQAFQMSESLPLKVFLKSSDKAAFTDAELFFKSFGIVVEKSAALIEVKPLIKTSVILAEVSRNASQSFGFQFPTEEQSQILPNLKGPEQVMVSLRALESKGLGRVLASPTLNCRSESEAEFHAGGEFPIRLTGLRRQAVEWKKHGVVLKVKPKADSSGAIQLSIESEISLIDSSQLVDGLPALKINRVSSHFDLKTKNTIAISGLIQESWSRGQSGLLGLSQIPLLGALFRSEEFLNHKSELIIFVTPEIIDTTGQSEIKWPREWFQNDL